MSHRINGRITGVVQPKSNFGLRISYFVLFLSFFPLSAHAHLFPSLKADDFKRISFVGRCEQNQWSTNKEDKLEIMLSAEPGESCEARLHFQTPQELKH